MAQAGHGLVLGKFMPPHAGHQYLVHLGQNFVERLTVLVCTLARDPIPGDLRYAWMRELFPAADVVHVTDDLPQEPADDPRFWEIWREVVLRAAGGPLDYVFASEAYGERLAAEVDATFIPVDRGRELVPISAREIRAAPLANWHFLPECVRPHYVKRVCIFGPESTGKSTLARDLAREFHTVYVSEFARGLLDAKGGRCDPDDIPVIARGQLAAEDAMARRANRVLFCDTDALLTTVWSDTFFGDCPAEIRHAAALRHYDLYLLLDVDVPWVDDQQRILPHARQAFFDRCRAVLEQHGRRYVVIRGDWRQRFVQACSAIQPLLVESAADR